MTPQVVNAVKSSAAECAEFSRCDHPAPYFDANADAAHNYGSMGAMIRTKSATASTTRKPVRRRRSWQTGGQKPISITSGQPAVLAVRSSTVTGHSPDLAVNGAAGAPSKNIADVAGLLAAYDAYPASRWTAKPDAVKKTDSREISGSSSVSRRVGDPVRDAQLRREIATDGHAPEQYRADTVRNLDPWYDAFSVQPSQKLALPPDKRVRVW